MIERFECLHVETLSLYLSGGRIPAYLAHPSVILGDSTLAQPRICG